MAQSLKRLGKQVKKCQICSNPKLNFFLSLGHHAPVHAHLTAEKLNEPEVSFPLNLCYCSRCGLTQLSYIVEPNIIFHPDYPYQSSLTTMLIRDFRELANNLIKQYNLKKSDMIIDVGSNDGTLLQGFKEKGLSVLGVEPTNIAKIANKKGIRTIQDFFNKKTAKEIVKKFGQARIITATNAFAHIDNVFDVLAGINLVLADNGVFVSESQYLMDTVEKIQFDCIYHEHLRYYSLKPLIKLLSLAGFSLIDAERIPVAGGSIRVYAVKGKKSASERVKKLLADEKKLGLYDLAALKDFAKKVNQAKIKLVSLLADCKKKGNRIVGIGAPGRSNTLLNFIRVDNTFLDYACEKKGSPKIGLFTPGTHIPIVDEEQLITDQPEFGLLLSWHIGEELIKKLRDRGYRGKFIIPLPEPKIIN